MPVSFSRSNEGADVPVLHGPVPLSHAQSGNDASRRFLVSYI